MSKTDIDEFTYKSKYIKYKKKYLELKKIDIGINNLLDKIIILPKEYNLLSKYHQTNFIIYEKNNMDIPISYIKKAYIEQFKGHFGEQIGSNLQDINTITTTDEDIILDKKIISPEEFFSLSDNNKLKYEINESDYNKFPNRVVPKNFIKIK